MKTNHLRRRDFLSVGIAGLAGGSFLDLFAMAQHAHATDPAISLQKPTSCILIWMDGGPTHFETFDPKPPQRFEVSFTQFQPMLPVFRYLRTCQDSLLLPISTPSFGPSVTTKEIMVPAITI